MPATPTLPPPRSVSRKKIFSTRWDQNIEARPSRTPWLPNPGSNAAGDPLAKLAATQGVHPDVAKAIQASAPKRELPADEVTWREKYGEVSLRMYQDAKARMAEVKAAQKVYQATGTMPQTKTPFAWIEIKQGTL